jgi:thioredoxin-like negative regulator of GroEL
MAAKPTRLADGDALDAFVADHDVALVEFYTAGCPVCANMEPVLSNVARASDVAVGVLDLGDEPSLSGRFGVRSVPALLLFRDGEVVDRLVDGFQGTEAVLSFVERTAEP